MLSVACEELKRCLYAPVAQHAVRSLTSVAFREALARDSAWHRAQPAGGLDRVFHRGSRALQTLLAAVSFNLVPTVLDAALVLVVLRRQFGPAVSACAALTLFVTVAIGVVLNERRRALTLEAIRRDNALSSLCVESFRGHELVKLACAEAQESRAYEGRVLGMLGVRVRLARSLGLLNVLQRLAFTSGLLAILLLALRDVRAGSLAASKLVVLNGLMRQLSSPVQQLGNSYTMARQACVDLGALLELSRAQRGADGAPRPQLPPLPSELGGGDLVFANVTVDIDVRPPPRILHGVSFTVAKGERVAIVGPSGAGKTTLLRVLALFQPLSGGQVLLGGHNLFQHDPTGVRRRLAVVPQEARSLLLLGEQPEDGGVESAREWWEAAVRYGAPDASAEVVARALDEVGLGAYRGQAGYTGLSAGELQRLALAHALSRDAAVLACDEPTAHLDALSAAQISTALSRAAAGRAVLVVAHDLRTVAEFDRIVVLDGGRCVDAGSHAELLGRCPTYVRLWETQSRGAYALPRPALPASVA
ncbi:P-loop containing nucleoside triphosphate hydrolase protein [Pavlovales sp. CCMP2436]|nr:P-loop containing nucleoside triphosphate hydrolase protein [Pavlovales sp. CCMP2436]